MLRGLEQLSSEDRLRELEWFSLERRRLQGRASITFQVLKGCKETREGLFTRVL